MKNNNTKLSKEQLDRVFDLYCGVRTCTIDRSLKKIINYVYKCAIENEKLTSSNCTSINVDTNYEKLFKSI